MHLLMQGGGGDLSLYIYIFFFFRIIIFEQCTTKQQSNSVFLEPNLSFTTQTHKHLLVQSKVQSECGAKGVQLETCLGQVDVLWSGR